MLLEAGLPEEAVMTSNYIQNRTIAKRVDQTPFEIWTGCKSDLKYLRIFDIKCFVHVLHEKRPS